MKNSYKINSWCILITILLYFTFWGGIIAQPVLGLIQIGISFYIIGHFNALPKFIKGLFITYGVLTTAIVMLLRLMAQSHDAGFAIMSLWILVTLCLAFFHLYITYKIKHL